MKEKRRERRLSEGEGEVTPDRRNSMDKVPVMRLEEVYPIWSPESDGSSVDHIIAVGWGPDHTGLCWPWSDPDVYTRTRPKTEGLLSPLSHPFLLLPSPFCSSHPIA